MRWIPLAVTSAVASAVVLGCGPKGDETNDGKLPVTARLVSGEVKYKGVPLGRGQLWFFSKVSDGDGHIRDAGIVNGRYKTPSAIFVGKYTVTITGDYVVEPELNLKMGDKEEREPLLPPLTNIVPKIYGNPNTSPLTCVVKGDDADVNFDVQ